MKTAFPLLIGLCLLFSACGHESRKEEPRENPSLQAELEVLRQQSARLKTDVQRLRKAIRNLEVYAFDLEAKLAHTSAETWNLDALAARRIMGDLMIEVDSLKRGIEAVSQVQ